MARSTARTADDRSVAHYVDCAERALHQLACALEWLQQLDDDIYRDVAATSCDAADNLRSAIGRLTEAHGPSASPSLNDSCLGPHRLAVSALRPTASALGISASASALDMTALARNLLLQRPIAGRR